MSDEKSKANKKPESIETTIYIVKDKLQPHPIHTFIHEKDALTYITTCPDREGAKFWIIVPCQLSSGSKSWPKA